MSESRKISNIRTFEFKLRDKFLPYEERDKSTSIPNNFEVNLYLVIRYVGYYLVMPKNRVGMIQSTY